MALYSALTRAMNWSAVSLDWVVPVAGASAGDRGRIEIVTDPTIPDRYSRDNRGARLRKRPARQPASAPRIGTSLASDSASSASGSEPATIPQPA